MNKKTTFLPALVIISSLVTGDALAQKALSKHIEPGKKDEPIEINSDRMRSEEGGKKIVFSGKVVGHWGDLEILSDVLEVYSTGEKGNADEVVAIGNVVITRGEKKARGDRAVYIDKQQKIILTGKPKAYAWEGKNMIEGLEMIFLLDADRFVVNDRVYMKIFPKDKNAPADAKGQTAKSPPPAAVAAKNQGTKASAAWEAKTEDAKPEATWSATTDQGAKAVGVTDAKAQDVKPIPSAIEAKGSNSKAAIPAGVEDKSQNIKPIPVTPNESASRTGKK